MMRKVCLAMFGFMAMLTSSLAAVAIQWQEYIGDPVFAPYLTTTIPDDYFPCVLYSSKNFDGNGDAVPYKMWHQGPSGIAVSYSSDGVHWSLQSEVIVDKFAFHPIVIYSPRKLPGGYHYQMWYWSGNPNTVPPTLTMFFTQSADGLNWTKPVPTTQDNVNFLSNTQDKKTNFNQFYGFGSVFYNPSPTYKKGKPFTFPYVVYYDSAKGSPTTSSPKECIALAYSSDGIHWIRFGNEAVMKPSGKSADWDGRYIHRASVVLLPQDNLYHMFYSGSNELSNTGLFYAHGIGHATSKDGIKWRADDSPIFQTTDFIHWRSDHVLAPSVISLGAGQGLQMWFSGGKSSYRGSPTDMRIGYATATVH